MAILGNSLNAMGTVQRTRRNFALPAIVLLCFKSAATVSAAGHQEALDAIAFELARQIAGAGITSVAVLDFSDFDGNISEFGSFMAEEISLALALSGRDFAVVDRAAVQALMQQKDISAASGAEAKIGKVLRDEIGVQALVIGTLTPFSETIRVAAKVLDTSTGKVVGATRGDIPRSEAMALLLSRIKPRPTPIPPWPADCDAMVSYPPLSAEEFQERMRKEDARMEAALGRNFKKVWKLEREAYKRYNKQDLPGAIRICETILASDPENWDAHRLLAAAFASRNVPPEKVLEHACRAIRFSSEKSLYLSVAIAFGKKGDKQRALAWLEKALAEGFEVKKQFYDQFFPAYVNDPDYLALLSKYSVAER